MLEFQQLQTFQTTFRFAKESQNARTGSALNAAFSAVFKAAYSQTLSPPGKPTQEAEPDSNV